MFRMHIILLFCLYTNILFSKEENRYFVSHDIEINEQESDALSYYYEQSILSFEPDTLLKHINTSFLNSKIDFYKANCLYLKSRILKLINQNEALLEVLLESKSYLEKKYDNSVLLGSVYLELSLLSTLSEEEIKKYRKLSKIILEKYPHSVAYAEYLYHEGRALSLRRKSRFIKYYYKSYFILKKKLFYYKMTMSNKVMQYEIQQLINNVSRGIGYYYEIKGKTSKCEHYYNLGLDSDRVLMNVINNNRNVAKGLLEKSYFHYYNKDIEQLRTLSNEFFDFIEGTYKKNIDAELLANGYLVRGRYHSYLNDYASAEKYYLAGIKELEDGNVKNRDVYKYYYEPLGDTYYRMEKYEESVLYFDKCLEIMTNKSDIFRTKIEIFNSLTFMDSLKAEKYLDNLIFEVESEENNDDFDKISLLDNIYTKAASHYHDKNPILAKKILEKAEELTKNKKSKFAIEKYLLLALLHQDQDVIYLDYLNKAIIECSKENDNNILNRLPKIEEVRYHQYLTKIYHIYAKYFKKNNDYKNAIKYYEYAIEWENKIKRIKNNNTNQNKYLEERILRIYKEYSLLLIEFYQKEKSVDIVENLYYAIEKSKSKELSQNVKEINLRISLGVSDTLIDQESKLKKKIFQLESKLFDIKDTDSPKYKELNQKISEAYNKHNLILHTIENNHKNYYRFKHEEDKVDFKSLKEQIKEDEIWIQYLMGDSSLIILALTDDDVYVDSKKLNLNQLDKHINNTVINVKDQSVNVYAHHAHQLYLLLMKDVLDNFPNKLKLNIIPHNKLNFIPFNALVENVDEEYQDYYSLPYLNRKYTIRYQFNTTTTYQSKKDKNHHKDILIINPTYVENTNYPPLDYAKEECEYISSIFKNSYFPDVVKKDLLVNYMNDYKIVHFSGHSDIDNGDDSFNKLVFESTDSMAQFYAYELYNAQIPAEMVVLSSCHSAAGEIKDGEGVMSLARGFAFAGCPSTVTGLWEINEAAGSEIMKVFYSELKKGKSKSEALQIAQNHLIEENPIQFSSPYFWAGFVVIGNDHPIEISSSFMSIYNKYSLFLFVGLLAFGMLFFMFKFFKK